jgi:hypothetical protein
VTLNGREEPAGGRYRLHQLVTTQNSLPIFLINAVGPSSRHPGQRLTGRSRPQPAFGGRPVSGNWSNQFTQVC